MSTTPATRPTLDPWVSYCRRNDRWDAFRAFVVVMVGMLVWTIAWAGGAVAVATIAVAALALVAVDVRTRQVRMDLPA